MPCNLFENNDLYFDKYNWKILGYVTFLILMIFHLRKTKKSGRGLVIHRLWRKNYRSFGVKMLKKSNLLMSSVVQWFSFSISSVSSEIFVCVFGNEEEWSFLLRKLRPKDSPFDWFEWVPKKCEIFVFNS